MSPVPRLSSQGTLKVLTSLILRRLFSNSESCAAPCYALLRAAWVGVLLQQAAAQGSAPTAAPEAEAESCTHYSAYKYLFEASMCCRSLSLLIVIKIAILLAVLGCSSNSDTEERGTPPTSTPPATAPPVAAGTALRLSPVATGLSGPVHITHAGDERLFIVEQPGRIRIVQQGRLVATPFLDIVSLVFH